MRYVLALDQGTTSSRALVFDRAGAVVSTGRRKFGQAYRRPGWVEHDAEEIWKAQRDAAREALQALPAGPQEIAAVGITNQRETTVIWERRGGAPIHPAIVWQSRQTVEITEQWKARGLEAEVQRRTGLLIDAYFSASKLRFILDAVPGAALRAARGELAFGTIDSWLLYKLTGGRVHATDASNASRTLCFNIHEGDWDETLLGAFDLPRELFPEVKDSSGVLGETQPELFGAALPVAGLAGDQQAALFGQGRFAPGGAKITYGTGCFLLMNTGDEAPLSRHKLLTTVAWRRAGRLQYALEGSIFEAGSVVQWLRDGLGLLDHAAQSEALARSVPDNGGLYLAPAFSGLGAPYWDERARGALLGITRSATRAHLARAALESIAYQCRDVVECFHADSAHAPDALRVDGGATANDFLMQFQADLLGVPVLRPKQLEVTALGAAMLAGLAVGLWQGDAALSDLLGGEETCFSPRMSSDQREALYADWKRAVERSRNWA